MKISTCLLTMTLSLATVTSAFATDCSMKHPEAASPTVLKILSRKFDLVQGVPFKFSLEKKIERQIIGGRGFNDSILASASVNLLDAASNEVLTSVNGSAVDSFVGNIDERALRKAIRRLPNCKRGEI